MTLKEVTTWLNNNQGLLTLILFLASIIIGWISGVFRSLIRKPRFKIRVIPKMTFATVYITGETYTPPGQGTYDEHLTAFAIYLEITNVGSAPSDIGKIQIGYYKDDGKRTWFQKRLWIKESNILDDFMIPTADGKAVRIPNLRQTNPQYDKSYDSFLEVGKSKIGVAYFEQALSWGNHYPRQEKEKINIIVLVKDAFNNSYRKSASVPVKNLEDAHRYNPKYGLTVFLFDVDAIEEKSPEDPKDEQGGAV